MKESGNRQVVLQLLLETGEGEHVSATHVHYRLTTQGHTIALSTAYSNLDALSDAGLIGEAYGVRGKRLFERRAEPHHLLCHACYRVQDLDPDAFSEACLHTLKGQASALGWRPAPLQLTLGCCPTCAESPPYPVSSAPKNSASKRESYEA